MTNEVIVSGAQWAEILLHKSQGQFCFIIIVKGNIIHQKEKQSEEGNPLQPPRATNTNRKHYGSFTFSKNWDQKSRTHLLQKKTLLYGFFDILRGINGCHALLQIVST